MEAIFISAQVAAEKDSAATPSSRERGLPALGDGLRERHRNVPSILP
jgi:hypothetical protein